MKSLPILLLAASAFAQPERGVTTRPNISSSSTPALTSTDVQAVIQSAAKSINAGMVVAVTDRQGDVLGVYQTPGAPATSVGNLGQVVNTAELAIALARTTSFFSNDQAPLTSRTVRFISASHFPMGIMYTESGPLYGIENTNRGCSYNTTFLPGQSVPPATLTFPVGATAPLPPGTTTPGLGIITGKANELDTDQEAVNPGSVPLYKNGPNGYAVVGGVGVAGIPANQAEFAAFSGAGGSGLAPPAIYEPFTGVIFLGGVALPGVLVADQSQPAGTSPGPGTGTYLFGPVPAPKPDPVGYLAGPIAGTVGGLTQAEVDGIIQNAIATANITRAAIRLPAGVPAKMAIAISDLDGTLLALYRMFDGTIFSIDVAVAKSRNVIYFTEAGLPGLSPEPPSPTAPSDSAASRFIPPASTIRRPARFSVSTRPILPIRAPRERIRRIRRIRAESSFSPAASRSTRTGCWWVD